MDCRLQQLGCGVHILELASPDEFVAQSRDLILHAYEDECSKANDRVLIRLIS